MRESIRSQGVIEKLRLNLLRSPIWVVGEAHVRSADSGIRKWIFFG